MSFLDLEINQKNYIKILCACIILVIIIVEISFASLLFPKEFVLENTTSIEPNEKLKVHIDILEPQGSKIEIAGYAYLEDESIRTVNSSYVLKNLDTGKMYLLKTRWEKNINVPEVYPVAGMHSRFITLGIENGKYEICVLYRNNENDIFKGTGINIDI